jgi:AraC family transcriptional regulator
MEVVILEREALKVVGMKISTTIEENKIPQLWNEFIPRIAELKEVAVPDCSLGICLYEGKDFEAGAPFSYLAAVVVKDDSVVPEGMIFYEIPATKVAVFTHTGSVENLAETYEYIYEEWLPESGYEIAEADELEWYDTRFKYDDPESQMDIHVPLKPAEEVTDEDLNDFLDTMNKL